MANSSARPRRDGVRTLLVLALASVSGLALSAPAWAQSADTGSRTAPVEQDYDIPAQPLSSALLGFAEQSGLQVLFSQDEVAGLVSRPVRGRLTPEAALAQLLPEGAPRIEIAGDRLVRAGRARPQHTRADEASAGEEIVVTGTRIRGAAPIGANLVTLDRDEIEQSGRSTIEEVLRTAPNVFPGSQNEVTQLNSTVGGSNIAFGSSVDLRGLGADATLTLVNGRRLAPAGFGNFVDISAIPLAAVERVEILADGASATYGADAIGGVVNIILRTSFEDAVTSVRFGGATQGGLSERVFSHVQGWRLADAHLMAGFEYRRRERLATEDRAFSRSSDLRPFGGDDFSNNRASPGNIVRIGTANVSYAIPAGQDGTALSESDLLAGQVNLQNLNLYADLAPEQERRSLFGSFRWEISAVELFADMFATRRESVMRDAQIAANIVVPESNYYRQLNSLFLGQGNLTIAYSFANDLGPIRYETQSDTVSLLAGAAIDLSRQWRAEANITIGRHEDHVRFLNGVDTTSLAPFLSGSTPESAFNPFSDGGGSLPSVLGAIQQHTSSDNSSELDAFGLKLDGPLWRMPGGQARAAFGVERRIDHFEITRTRYNAAGASPILPAQRPGDRTTDGYFAELYLPLLADLPLVSRFDLSLSARHESADTYEGETTPRIGVRWEISPDLALRGAWGTSFKAPRFDQLYLTTTAAYAVATPAQDPFADNGSTGALLLAGGNPSLEPEDAETWTAGLDVHPSWLSGFEFKATYFDVDFANRIGAAGDVLTAIRNPASFAAVLIRDPSPEQIAYYSSLAATIGGVFPADGVELIYDGRLVNVSSQRVRGVDVSASYDLPVAGGELVFFLDASRLLEFSRAPLPNAPTINQLDTLYNPIDLRMRAGLSWSGARWRASATVNYADDYRDTISTPNRKVDSWTTYDLRLGVGLDRDIASQRRTELTLNIQNLLDEDPPFVNNTLGLGFDAVNASPAGRVVSIELRRRW